MVNTVPLFTTPRKGTATKVARAASLSARFVTEFPAYREVL
ncbi:hypothetical protein PN465_02160 [Nodularia spumigena CS-584]|nr:hypothetical protein [Nodularia spumigena]AHJ26675.1 hypothetical protein NSP_3230 [Nodularia spumigena CCY9414]MDB9381048.1 hypothetical protein [Nodularia spumigena CS-584]MDP5338464.1 hypothetical protein [Nodularia sp. (in: cyanobacteria)]